MKIVSLGGKLFRGVWGGFFLPKRDFRISGGWNSVFENRGGCPSQKCIINPKNNIFWVAGGEKATNRRNISIEWFKLNIKYCRGAKINNSCVFPIRTKIHCLVLVCAGVCDVGRVFRVSLNFVMIKVQHIWSMQVLNIALGKALSHRQNKTVSMAHF